MPFKPKVPDRVLVVEDNLDLAENIAEMLSEEALAVTLAGDAEQAVLFARETGFDLAIVDIGLGGKESGLDLIPRLKRESVHGEVLLMTGNASLQSALLAIRSGVYAYVPKPFDSDQFAALVRRALAQVALKREKHALTQRLAASEALYRGVVDTVETLIFGLDAQGHIRFANRFASERFELSVSELVGQSLTTFASAVPDSRFENAVSCALAGESVRDLEVVYHVGRKPRSVRWTLTPLVAQSVRESESAAYAVVLAVGIDLTDRLDLERRHAEAEAMAAMGTLTTSLAHEIRNPLNAAKLQLELLTRRAKRSADLSGMEQVVAPAQIVGTELQRLSTLLDEFLSLARPRQIRYEQVRVRELLESVVALKGPLAQSQGITLRVRDMRLDLEIRADSDRLKQVLLNLVGNAIEALSEEKREAKEITLWAQPYARGTLLSVLDNGPGLSVHVAEAAFKPFVTDKPGGTGLGLAIVHRIVSQHGGSVELLANPGGGTEARIFLPN